MGLRKEAAPSLLLMLTSGSQSSICGLRVGDFQAPQEELKAPLREPLLPPIEGLQPVDILHIQVILYETLIEVADTACMFGVFVARWGM